MHTGMMSTGSKGRGPGGVGNSEDGLSFISLDDLEPRPPPRVNRFPAPFDFPKKPTPAVPDVSLIMDSDFTPTFPKNTPKSYMDSMNSSGNTTNTSSGFLTASALLQANANANTSTTANKTLSSAVNVFSPPPNSASTSTNLNQIRTLQQQTTPAPTATATSTSANSANNNSIGKESKNTGESFRLALASTSTSSHEMGMREQMQSLNLKLDGQTAIISKMEEKLDKLIDFQEKFLSQLFRKGSAISQSVQTDPLMTSPRTQKSNSSKKSSPKTSGNKVDIRSPPILRQPQSNMNINQRPNCVRISEVKSKSSNPLLRVKRDNKTSPDDSLSTILKDMQLPNMAEPSMFSEMTSLKSLELQEFNDDSFHSGSSGPDSPILGASASDYTHKSKNSSPSCSSSGSGSGIGSPPSSPVIKVKPTNSNVLGNISANANTKRNQLAESHPPDSHSNSHSRSPNGYNEFGQMQNQNQQKFQNRSNEHSNGNRFCNSNQNQHRYNYNNAGEGLDGNGNGSNRDLVLRRSSNASSSSASADENCFQISRGRNQAMAMQNQNRNQRPLTPTTHLNRGNVHENEEASGNDVVQATKNYLEKLGVQFGSPSASPRQLAVANHNRNYMIQQNVYNSIYIPTVTCAPVVPEAIDSNPGGPASNFHSLAQKYASPEELRHFDALKAESGKEVTETTVYGMTPSNLSFATKDYLQRYGLVNSDMQNSPATSNMTGRHVNAEGNATSPFNNGHGQRSPRILSPQLQRVAMTHGYEQQRNDRILDITAIKNQPKLL